jgi:hypothetical protein
MPVYFNDSVDDILLYDRQASFIGGQVSNFRENLLNESQAELIKDMSPEISGVLKTRRGFHRFANLLGSTSNSTYVQAIHFFDTDSRERVITAVNGSIYEIESNGTVTAIAVAASKLASATNPAYMCQIADKMYWSSDTSTTKIFELKYSGGAWVKTDATDVAPLNSKYLIANSGRVFAYDVSGNQIYVSTILPNLAASVKINNGGGYAIGDYTTSGMTVDSLPIGLSNGQTIVFSGGGSLLLSAAAVETDTTIYGTLSVALVADDEEAAVATTLFTMGGVTINPFKVGTGAETVTAMHSWVGFNVVVFCENSIYLVDTNPLTAATAAAGNATSTFKIRQVSNLSGAISHRAVAQVGEDLLFLARDGVRSLKRTMAEEMVAEQSGVISYPIQDLIDSINWSAAAQQATATFWNGLFLLSVPILSSSENNCCLVYSANTNSWIGYWQGNPDHNIKPIDFCISAFGGYAEKLLTLDKIGNPMEFRDYISPQNATATDYQDNFDGTNYRDTAWQALTRGMTFGDQLSPKSPDFTEWEFDRSNAKVDIIPVLDGEDADRLVTNLVTGSGTVSLATTGTVTINNGAGYAVGDYTSSGIAVDALPIALSSGQTLFFSGGGRLSLSALASIGAVVVYGTLYDAALVDNEEAVVGTSSTTLPFTLPDSKVRRFRYSLSQYDPFRELQFRIEQSTGDTSSNKYVALRSIQAGSFMDTMEGDQ